MTEALCSAILIAIFNLGRPVPLQPDPGLAVAAVEKAERMAREDRVGHDGPTGQGEIVAIAYGPVDVRSAIVESGMAYLASPEHAEVLAESRLIGCGYSVSATGNVYTACRSLR